MRAIDIAIFMFSINLAISILNAGGIFTDTTQFNQDTGYTTTISSQVENGSLNPSAITQMSGVDLLWGFIAGLVQLGYILAYSTAGVYFLVWSFFGYSMNATVLAIVAAYSGIVYMSYLLGIAQFVSGRNVREME